MPVTLTKTWPWDFEVDGGYVLIVSKILFLSHAWNEKASAAGGKGGRKGVWGWDAHPFGCSNDGILVQF